MADKCSCGRYTVQRMAWTEKNAGRRFAACADRYSGCGFFEWAEPPLPHGETATINGLLNRIRAMEDVHRREVEDLRQKYEKEIETLKSKPMIPRVVYVMVSLFIIFLVMNGSSTEIG